MKWEEVQHPRDANGRFTNSHNAEQTHNTKTNEVRYYLPDETLPKSVGAKWSNYRVLDLKTMRAYHFVEGSRLQNIEVFCGKGTHTPYHKGYVFAEKYGGKPEEWQHVKGFGVLETEHGLCRAEIHWSQHDTYGKQELFIKKWLDDE